MNDFKLQDRINQILKEIPNATPVVREFVIGSRIGLNAALIYLDGMIEKNIIDRDILRPLMHYVKDDIFTEINIAEYLTKRYIAMSNTIVEVEIQKAYFFIKRGKTVLLLDNIKEFIVLDTTAGLTRNITEPINETAVRGGRDGFIENIETNVSLLKRKIKDRNFTSELIEVGNRTQSDVALVYIDDIVDKDILNTLRERIKLIDVDGVLATGQIEQYTEDYPYTIFPQFFGSERPDVIASHLLEGRIAIILDGTPFVICAPTVLTEFFQTVEDYYQRTIIANIIRILRLMSVLVVVYLPAIYLTLTKFNPELIPIKFVIPIVRTRREIALTPFLEIMSMIFVVELLREGGLRLPSKIAQTLSVVGGFIIGNAALEAKLVSSTTLLIIGVTTIATFVIPYYNMALTVRVLKLIMLFLANFLGLIGIAFGTFIISVHLFSIDSFGVPYFKIPTPDDMKDFIVRSPLWKMNRRPKIIPNQDPVRQTDFREKFGGNTDEKGGKQ